MKEILCTPVIGDYARKFEVNSASGGHVHIAGFGREKKLRVNLAPKIASFNTAPVAAVNCSMLCLQIFILTLSRKWKVLLHYFNYSKVASGVMNSNW